MLWYEDSSDVIMIHLNSSWGYGVSDRFNSHKSLWFFPSQTKITYNLGISEWLSAETIKQRIYIISGTELGFTAVKMSTLIFWPLTPFRLVDTG